MGKQKTRQRPTIESVQKQHVNREEHPQCATPDCRNVVAVWSKHKLCSLCRAGVG